METLKKLYHRWQRYRTLHTHRVEALPLVILMPHSACNCRCVMCDIWKNNAHATRIREEDLDKLLPALEKLGTREVLMSGGEALLNPNFFSLCEMLNRRGIRISLLSTGITLARHAPAVVKHVHDLVVSLDGDAALHDRIRNIPSAFAKLREGLEAVRLEKDDYPLSSRTVIHRLNYRHWIRIIETGLELGLDRMSFLPADVSSQAFNREIPWTPARREEIMLSREELPELKQGVERVIRFVEKNNLGSFIAESSEKLQRIYQYYAALWGEAPFPFKKCNAPWVSVVVEADGTVRPCFFHAPIGHLKENGFEEILNGDAAMEFRRGLDLQRNETCRRCVCSLYLSPQNSLSA